MPNRWGQTALERGLLIGFVGLVLVHTACLAISSFKYNGAFKPDSAFYIDGAENVLRGRGLSSSMAIFNEAIDAKQELPIPMTQWAPLYPLLIAACAAFTGNAAQAALALPMAGYLASILLCLALVRNQFGVGAAIFATACLLIFAPLRAASTAALSETLGVCLLLAALLFASLRSRGWRDFALAAAAGVAAGLAFSTRYALAPLVLVVIACAFPARDRTHALKCAASSALGFALLFVPIAARNLWHSGHVRGAVPVPSTYTAGKVYAQLEATFARAWTINLPIAALVLQVAGVAVLGALAWLAYKRKLRPALKESLGRPLNWALPAWACLYLAFIVYSEIAMAIDPIDSRLALPSLVPITIFAAAAVSHVCIPPGRHWIPSVVGLIIAGIVTADSFSNAKHLLRTNLKPVYDFAQMRNREQGLNWIATNTTEKDLVIGEEIIQAAVAVGHRDFLFTQVDYPETYAVSWSGFMRYLNEGAAKYERIFMLYAKDITRKTGMRPGDGTFLDAFDPVGMGRPSNVRIVVELDDCYVFEVTREAR